MFMIQEVSSRWLTTVTFFNTSLQENDVADTSSECSSDFSAEQEQNVSENGHWFIVNEKETYLATVEGKDTDIPAMVDMVSPHHGVRMVLHPHSSKSVPANLIVFIDTLQNTYPHGNILCIMYQSNI